MRYPAAEHVSKVEWLLCGLFLLVFALSAALGIVVLVSGIVLIFRALNN